MPGPLKNSRIEKFVQAYAGGEPAYKAYMRFYKASQKAAEANSSRLLSKDKVKARLAEIQGKGEKKALLTMQRRRELLVERAEKPEITESALCAILRLDAQLAGELIDKTDLTTDGEALPAMLPSINFQMPASYIERRSGHN